MSKHYVTATEVLEKQKDLEAEKRKLILLTEFYLDELMNIILRNIMRAKEAKDD